MRFILPIGMIARVCAVLRLERKFGGSLGLWVSGSLGFFTEFIFTYCVGLRKIVENTT